MKQDCERVAFKRLSEEIKRLFPRLNMCVVVDGLYPNAPFFDICDTQGWRFICTFKEGNLLSLQAKIEACLSQGSENTLCENSQISDNKIERVYRWINGLDYSGFEITWVECIESITDSNNETETTRYVYLLSEKIDSSTVVNYVQAGRLRQKIENEGFNTQKNGGYKMEHKYSRVSLQATKNYYQCLQIGHMINQLCVLSQIVKKQLIEWDTTLKQCWKALFGFLTYASINKEELDVFLQKRTQYRYLFLS